MTIEDAIQHCEDVAASKTEQWKCPECAADHKQLAKWLRELVALRAQQSRTLDRSRWEAHPVIKRRPYRSERFEEAKLSEEGEVLYRKIVTIHEDWTDDYCSACGKKLCSRFTNYCPACGRPLTEESWAELERRIGGNDGTAD